MTPLVSKRQSTPLAPTAENFRVEMARYRLKREEVCSVINMNLNLLSMYVSGTRKMSKDTTNDIAYAINKITGQPIFFVDVEPTPEY